jgi:hypothetical protein
MTIVTVIVRLVGGLIVMPTGGCGTEEGTGER